MAATLDLASPPRPRTTAGHTRTRTDTILEFVVVLASPLVLYAALRLRGMAPPQIADPSMHTTFIVDPHDIFTRYAALFTPSARLREAARVGFLVPARISYLLFGAIPGFFVFRYLLALIAIVPLYLLLRRRYGRWAGFIGIAVVMSSPVLITAWGTDYPDSAAVSYLTGGLAALGLSFDPGRWRRGWVIVAGCLLTAAVWTHGISDPLVLATLVVYLSVRLWRGRGGLMTDFALLAGTAVVTTGLLAVCSALLIGQFDFIGPTIQSARVLSTASAVRANHSSSWSWAPYDVYLLVPPAVIASFVVVFARRWRGVGTAVLFVGLAGAAQLATFAFLQFFGSLQALEMHYFSSTLWSSVTVVLAVTLAEMARPLVEGSGRPYSSRWWVAHAAPAILVLVVAWGYEASVKLHVRLPQMTWTHLGLAVAALAILAAALGALLPLRPVAAGAVVALAGALLVLTVAPPTPHEALADTNYDPIPKYAEALGGNDTTYESKYKVTTELPGFVAPAAHKGQLLMTWEPRNQFGDLLGPMGMYHNAITWVSESFPVLSPTGTRKVESWRTAQVLLMSLTGNHFPQAVRSLRSFLPVVVRRAVLSDGPFHLHVWLVDLRRYLRAPAPA